MILTMSGSLRRVSSNAALLQAAALVAPELELTPYLGLAELPPFNPDLDDEGAPQPVLDFRARLEEIAAKTGKSAAHVRNRLQLCVLPEAARKAVTEGNLLVSVAYLVARLPEYVLDAATSIVLSGVAYSNQPMPLATARRLLEQKFTLRLADAPFSRTDAALVPEAGPCSTCPKRTGNQAEMFGEAATEDLCTDAACFNNKMRVPEPPDHPFRADPITRSGRTRSVIPEHPITSPVGQKRLQGEGLEAARG